MYSSEKQYLMTQSPFSKNNSQYNKEYITGKKQSNYGFKLYTLVHGQLCYVRFQCAYATHGKRTWHIWPCMLNLVAQTIDSLRIGPKKKDYDVDYSITFGNIFVVFY